MDAERGEEAPVIAAYPWAVIWWEQDAGGIHARVHPTKTEETARVFAASKTEGPDGEQMTPTVFRAQYRVKVRTLRSITGVPVE